MPSDQNSGLGYLTWHVGVYFVILSEILKMKWDRENELRFYWGGENDDVSLDNWKKKLLKFWYFWCIQLFSNAEVYFLFIRLSVKTLLFSPLFFYYFFYKISPGISWCVLDFQCTKLKYFFCKISKFITLLKKFRYKLI